MGTVEKEMTAAHRDEAQEGGEGSKSPGPAAIKLGGGLSGRKAKKSFGGGGQKKDKGVSRKKNTETLSRLNNKNPRNDTDDQASFQPANECIRPPTAIHKEIGKKRCSEGIRLFCNPTQKNKKFHPQPKKKAEGGTEKKPPPKSTKKNRRKHAIEWAGRNCVQREKVESRRRYSGAGGQNPNCPFLCVREKRVEAKENRERADDQPR